jgi:hypothetical protein
MNLRCKCIGVVTPDKAGYAVDGWFLPSCLFNRNVHLYVRTVPLIRSKLKRLIDAWLNLNLAGSGIYVIDPLGEVGLHSHRYDLWCIS